MNHVIRSVLVVCLTTITCIAGEAAAQDLSGLAGIQKALSTVADIAATYNVDVKADPGATDGMPVAQLQGRVELTIKGDKFHEKSITGSNVEFPGWNEEFAFDGDNCYWLDHKSKQMIIKKGSASAARGVFMPMSPFYYPFTMFSQQSSDENPTHFLTVSEIIAGKLEPVSSAKDRVVFKGFNMNGKAIVHIYSAWKDVPGYTGGPLPTVIQRSVANAKPMSEAVLTYRFDQGYPVVAKIVEQVRDEDGKGIYTSTSTLDTFKVNGGVSDNEFILDPRQAARVVDADEKKVLNPHAK